MNRSRVSTTSSVARTATVQPDGGGVSCVHGGVSFAPTKTQPNKASRRASTHAVADHQYR